MKSPARTAGDRGALGGVTLSERIISLVMLMFKSPYRGWTRDGRAPCELVTYEREWPKRAAVSVGGCAGCLDERFSLLEFRLQILLKLRRGRAHGNETLIGQAFLDIGLTERLADFLAHFLNDFIWSASRCDETKPRVRGEVSEAQFLEGRHVLGCVDPLIVGQRDGDQLAGSHMGKNVRYVGKHVLHVAAQQVVQCGCLPLVGHVRQVGTGLRLEHFDRQVRRGARTKGGKAQ